MKIAVAFCLCGTNVSERVDAAAVKEGLRGGPDEIAFETFEFLCSEEGKTAFSAWLAAEAPGRVVVAGCSPRDHEATFRRLTQGAGINPYLMQMVNIREQVAWVTPDRGKATEKAVRAVRAAIARVRLHEPLEKTEIDARPGVLVVGAGPAGLKAALSLAEAGRKVTIVEKGPNIGGLPVLYEEVFPAMECGPCMLEPVMDEAIHGAHASDIEILTLSEVVGVKGFFGSFDVTIRRKARHIDMDRCIGCAECSAVCPVEVPNEINGGRDARKAIALPFAGALPNAPFLDEAACLRFRGGECTACRDACPVGEGVVLYDEAEATLTREVGAVVLATGAGFYDVSAIPGLGYGRVEGVLTSLDFERMLSSNGPTGAQIVSRAGKAPRSVAIVHCVGSLDGRHRPYCSGVCCQDAFKFSHLISGKLPGTKVVHLFKEIAVSGKDAYSLLGHARENPSVSFLRYRDIADVSVIANRGRCRIQYKDDAGKAGRVAADLVVLCPAVVPSPGAAALGKLFDVARDRQGFFEELHGRLDAARSKIKGVFLAGTCQGPMDIQGAMTQGIATAGYVLSQLPEGKRLEIEPIVAHVDEDRCSGCRVCIAVCPYKAIGFDEEKDAAKVNAVLCQGCGTCVAACPSGAMAGSHFTNDEIRAEVREALR